MYANAGIVDALIELLNSGSGPRTSAAIDVLVQLVLHHQHMRLPDDGPHWGLWGSANLVALVMTGGNAICTRGAPHSRHNLSVL